MYYTKNDPIQTLKPALIEKARDRPQISEFNPKKSPLPENTYLKLPNSANPLKTMDI